MTKPRINRAKKIQSVVIDFTSPTQNKENLFTPETSIRTALKNVDDMVVFIGGFLDKDNKVHVGFSYSSGEERLLLATELYEYIKDTLDGDVDD